VNYQITIFLLYHLPEFSGIELPAVAFSFYKK